jgi:NAD(P)-dependent dehydrogenase (short-subunit alcohol dehydrogenase family)
MTYFGTLCISGNASYVVSKVGLSTLTRIQQREMDKDSLGRKDIAINHISPGHVDTDMTRHRGAFRRCFFRNISIKR